MSVSKHVGQGSRPSPSVPAERCDGLTGALRAVRHTAGSHGPPQHGATGERRCLWAVAGLHRATAARLLKLPVRETRSHLVQVGRLEEAVLGSACIPKGASVTLVCKVSIDKAQYDRYCTWWAQSLLALAPRSTVDGGR